MATRGTTQQARLRVAVDLVADGAELVLGPQAPTRIAQQVTQVPLSEKSVKRTNCKTPLLWISLLTNQLSPGCFLGVS